MIVRWSWAEACARRLERQGLAVPFGDASPAGICSAMCGAHAQVLSAAEWSIGLRLARGTRADVRDALWKERSLIKTFGPRGTVHLLATRDLPMWIGALAAVPLSRNIETENAVLTREQTEEVIAAIGAVLQNAELTTDELTEALVRRVGAWAADPIMDAFQTKWARWRMATSTAGARGALCYGPNRGRQVTYTSPQRWLPGFQSMDGPSALAELVRRYLYAYGPATSHDLARWLAAPPRWAAELFDSMRGELQQVELEGSAAWVPAGDDYAPPAAAAGVRLLPYFDAYVVGSHPRRLLFPGRAAERALARGGAGNYPVLLLDGIACGVWHQRRSGHNVDIMVEPFVPLSAMQLRALDEQVKRFGEFAGLHPRRSIGTVSIGAHA